MNILKKIKPFDYLIIFIVIFGLIVGFLTFTKKRTTSSKQIEANVNIELEIYLRGVATTSDEPLFKAGDETFITIRNVPYTKLKIKSVKYEKRKIMLPSLNPKKPYVLANDETFPFHYDYLVTVVDDAKITKDGDAVVGGNKVKIGLPITLEGPKYKFNGAVTNIVLSQKPQNQGHEELDEYTKINQDVH